MTDNSSTNGTQPDESKRYRLSLRKVQDDNEVWSVRISRTRVWLMGLLVFTIVAVVLGAVVLGTPLSSLLPGYLKPADRHLHVENTLRVDSLQDIMNRQMAYINNISAIMLDRIDADTMAMSRLITPVTDTLAGTSDAEKQFVKDWEERERYSLNVLTPVAADRMVMVRPVPMGVVDTVTSGTVREMLLTVPDGSAVNAICAGTVVGVSYEVPRGYTVVLQHQGEFVSAYSGLKGVTVDRGAKVKSGQAIGRAGNARVGVTIWSRGVSVDPGTLLPY